MTTAQFKEPSDDSIDVLVVAIQALIKPNTSDLALPAIDKGNEIVRKWLALHCKA